MRIVNRYITSLALAAALVAPVAIMAAPVPQDGGVQIRIYDRRHKDYHNWDDRESRSWGIFLSDNHRRSHEYNRASRREQEQYWNWRHQHPDRD